MQNFIQNNKPLLDEKGNLSEKGYSTTLILDYNRNDIKVPKFKIKEWDYYYVGNDKYGIALTIADNGYMGLIGASFINFETKVQETKNLMKFFTFGNLKLPSTSKIGDVGINYKNCQMSFKNDGTTRTLFCRYDNFYNNKPLEIDVKLFDEPKESMVIATPFDKPKHFYYNQKINCIKASGKAIFDDKEYLFNETNSFGLLDWGRGVWTYNNTWYWGSLSTKVNGINFGFNIGYGFGNCENATENMIFYDNKAHKFDKIKFDIPIKEGKEEYLSEWKFTTNDGKLDMTFVPLLDRFNSTDLKILCSIQHQVFGWFSGKAILEDGREIIFENKLGFAEKVFNKW